MDRHDFDDLARAFAWGSDRRTLLRRTLGGVLGGAVVLRAGVAQAQEVADGATCRGLTEACNGNGPG